MATTPRTRTPRKKAPAAAPEVEAEVTPATAEPDPTPQGEAETSPESAPMAEAVSEASAPEAPAEDPAPTVTPEPVPAAEASVPGDTTEAQPWQVPPITFGNLPTTFGNLNEASEKMQKNYEEFAAYARANADAASAAYTTLFKGVDSYTKALFSFYRGMFEMTMATSKEIISAKSFNEVVELQNNYARNLMDGFVSEGTKLSEMGMTVANEAMAPINERVSATVETLKKSAAA